MIWCKAECVRLFFCSQLRAEPAAASGSHVSTTQRYRHKHSCTRVSQTEARRCSATVRARGFRPGVCCRSWSPAWQTRTTSCWSRTCRAGISSSSTNCAARQYAA